MRKFIFKIILLIVPIVVFMFIADFYITDNLKNSHTSPGEIEVWNDIYSGNIDSDIAIYGSSRAFVHISPSILEDSLNMNAYNFGMDGHHIKLQYLRHKEYLKYNRPPKLIIMALDAFSLSKRKDLYGLNQFLPYMLWNENIIEYTSSHDGFNFEDYYFPLFRYYGRMRGQNSVSEISSNISSKKTYRQRGYKGRDKKWNDDLAKAKLKMTQYSIDIYSSSINLFEQFLLECKSNNTAVILVYTPEHIEGQRFVKNRKEIFKMYHDFSKKYDLAFLDYSNDDICHEKDFFYNASHLNKKGSELFTRKLSYDLKVLMHDKAF